MLFLLSISWNLREFNVFCFFLYSEFNEFSVGWKIFFSCFETFSHLIFRISYKISVNSIILFFSFFVQLISRIFLLSDFFFFLRRGKNARFFRHSVVKREILSHRKKISSNQFFGNFFSKTIAFTKFLWKKCEREFLQFPYCVREISD